MNLPSMAHIKPSMTVRPFETRCYLEKETSTRNNEVEKSEKNSNVFQYITNTFNRTQARALNIRTKVTRGSWRVWLLGLCIYMVIVLTTEGDPDELLTEEDHVSLREWVRENDEVLRSEYRERAKVAHEMCSQYDVYVSPKEYSNLPGTQQQLEYSDWLALKRVNWHYMYYVPSQDFVYCKVPKSGSSTWVYNLLKLAKVPEELMSSDNIGLHKLIRDYYPQMSSSRMKRVFKRSFKLLVVRHPFDRILSAYRDKMENYQRDLRFRDGYYYTMYGKNIVRVYRNQKDITLANRTEPTWPEFVKYLINTPASKFDEHWKPIFMLCSPCVLKYDVISKMNTFSEDTQYVINQLGLEDRLHVEWIHRTSDSRTSEVAKAYFSKLTRNQMDHLFSKYHLDFELFGFNYDDYREMGQS